MSSENWKHLEIEYGGWRVNGTYEVSDGKVTVTSWNGTKTAPLGILPAERVARMLLRELASEQEIN
jgi:hypothetical protein